MYTEKLAGTCTAVILILLVRLLSPRFHPFVHIAALRQTPITPTAGRATSWTSKPSVSVQSSSSFSRFCALGSAVDSDQNWDEIMYGQLTRKRQSVRYQVIAAEACEPLGRRMAEKYPDRFTFHHTTWAKFPDGTDNIEIDGFSHPNLISGEHVLFLGSFHSNDTTLSQFQVMICLLQSFIESLTVVLPFSPVGTMERVTKEGQVATAATYAHSEFIFFLSLQ